MANRLRSEIGARLGEAIAAGQYANAGKILCEYRREVDQSPSAEAVQEAVDLLETMRRAVLAARADAAARLRSLSLPYRQAGAREVHTWEVEG